MLERDQGHLLIQEVALAVHEGLAGSERDRPTLRDRFAMSVVQGWLASWPSEQRLDTDDTQAAVARFAYHMADVMLSARERGDGWRTLRCASCAREVRVRAGDIDHLSDGPPCPFHEDGDSPCLRAVEVQR